MKDDKLPCISVIITAYNRKAFLLSAIKSAINQTLDKKYYEIMVIKNFSDEYIDDFLNENKIKHILMDGTVSEFLYTGVSEVNGDVISFLDDDDFFSKNKLEVVYNEFKRDSSIVYYHNLCVPINTNLEIIGKNDIDTSIQFNMSSISVKKSIVKIGELDKINILQDELMYLYALESNKNIIKGNEKLTYYMYHESASNIVCSDFEEYRKFIINQSDLYLNTFKSFRNLVHSKKAINYLNSRITGTQISKYIFGSDEKPRNLINYIIHSQSLGNLKYRVTFVLFYRLFTLSCG